LATVRLEPIFLAGILELILFSFAPCEFKFTSEVMDTERLRILVVEVLPMGGFSEVYWIVRLDPIFFALDPAR
jgi:hypothetical protein